MFKNLQLIFGFFSITIFCFYFGPNIIQQIKDNLRFNISFLLSSFVVWTALYLAKSKLTERLYDKFGFKISLKELFSISIFTSLLSYIFPLNLSTGLKVFYLKIQHKLSFIKFGQIEIFSFIVLYFGYIVFFIAGYFSSITSILYLPITILSLLILFPLVYNLLKKYIKYELPKFDLHIYLYAIINDILYIILLYLVIVEYLKISINLNGILMWAAIIQFSQIINVTPGNLGVREWVMVLTAPFINISEEDGAFISVIVRIISIIYLLVWYLFSYKILFVDSKIKFLEFYDIYRKKHRRCPDGKTLYRTNS